MVAVRRVSVLLAAPSYVLVIGNRLLLGSGEACFVYTFQSACFWGLCVFVCTQSSLTVCDPMDCSPPDSSDQRDSPGKNIGVGWHFLLQGSLPDPGIKPASLASPALAGGFFTTSATWEGPGVYAAAAKSLQSRPTLWDPWGLWSQSQAKGPKIPSQCAWLWFCMQRLGCLAVLSKSSMEMYVYSISPGVELSWNCTSETKSPENWLVLLSSWLTSTQTLIALLVSSALNSFLVSSNLKPVLTER